MKRADVGGISTMSSERTKDLGLALGGGGMKGLAHVGAISVIERIGLKPSIVSGTSIGAIIGAMYAAGMSTDDMKEAADSQPLLSLLSLRFDGKGLVDTTGLRTFLSAHIGEPEFKDLPITLYVTATDLESGELVLLDSGPVIDAVLASSAVPGIFAPVIWKGRHLMDGGMIQNLPVQPLRKHGARKTIGIRLFHQNHSWKLDEARRRGKPDAGTRRKWRERMSMEDLRHLPASVIQRWLQAGHPGIEAFRIAQRGLDMMISRQESEQLTSCPPDVLVSPDVVDVGALDFHEDKAGMYKAGVHAAEAVEAELATLLQQ